MQRPLSHLYRLAVPVLHTLAPCRPLVGNFQVTVANGAAVLLHAAAQGADAVQADRKYIMAFGRLECAVNGVVDVHRDDQGLGPALLRFCEGKAGSGASPPAGQPRESRVQA